MTKNFVFSVFCQKGVTGECFDSGDGLEAFMAIMKDPEHEHVKKLRSDDQIVKLKAFDVYASRDGALGELPDAEELRTLLRTQYEFFENSLLGGL